MDLVVDNLGYDIWEGYEDIPQSSSPIWILGKKYENSENLDHVRDKINSILWLSYRKGFQPIASQTASYQYTSDKGFGCMIRCSQMLIAETLRRIHLPESWNWTQETTNEAYLDIVSRFEDSPEAAYSIQRMALAGEDSGKKVSEWFGPNEISQILKNIVPLDEAFSQFSVYVALDSQLAIKEIVEDFKPTLIIIPLRLGLSEINAIYIDSLKKCLELKSSMGIIGGRPNQALYFFGYLDDDILYHDPHVCQRSGSVGRKQTPAEVELDETYHKRSPGRMAFTSMDPSIAVSFFCKTKADFDELVDQLRNDLKDEKNPIFEVIQSRSDFSRDFEHDLDIICGDQHSADRADGEQSDDDFEIIL